MKNIYKQAKWVGICLSILMTLQSCRVYKTQKVSATDAVISEKRILVKDIYDRKFKFKKLVYENETLYGLAKKNTYTAKTLDLAIEGPKIDNRYVKIKLDEKRIREYHEHNKTLSLLLSLGVPAIGIGILALIPAKKSDYDFDLQL